MISVDFQRNCKLKKHSVFASLEAIKLDIMQQRRAKERFSQLFYFYILPWNQIFANQ